MNTVYQRVFWEDRSGKTVRGILFGAVCPHFCNQVNAPFDSEGEDKIFIAIVAVQSQTKMDENGPDCPKGFKRTTMVFEGPTEVIIIIKFIINIIMIIIMMLPTVGDPSWAHSTAHPTESPPSHLLHSPMTIMMMM